MRTSCPIRTAFSHLGTSRAGSSGPGSDRGAGPWTTKSVPAPPLEKKFAPRAIGYRPLATKPTECMPGGPVKAMQPASRMNGKCDRPEVHHPANLSGAWATHRCSPTGMTSRTDGRRGARYAGACAIGRPANAPYVSRRRTSSVGPVLATTAGSPVDCPFKAAPYWQAMACPFLVLTRANIRKKLDARPKRSASTDFCGTVGKIRSVLPTVAS